MAKPTVLGEPLYMPLVKQPVPNVVIVSGLTDADAQFWDNPGKKPLARFMIANWFMGRKSTAVWVPIYCFGDLAVEAKDIKKGQRVCVEGRLRMARYNVKLCNVHHKELAVTARAITIRPRPKKKKDEENELAFLVK